MIGKLLCFIGQHAWSTWMRCAFVGWNFTTHYDQRYCLRCAIDDVKILE